MRISDWSSDVCSSDLLFKNCPLDFDEKALALLDDSARALLGKTADALAPVQSWTVEAIEEAIRRVAEDAGLGLGKVAQPLRAALTGRTVSPGIFDVLFLLGKEESLEGSSAVRQASAHGSIRKTPCRITMQF